MRVAMWKRAVMTLACVGMIIPQGTLMAAEKTQPNAKTVQVLDVKLTDGGTLAGQVVDSQGKAIAGATVQVRFANHVVAVAKTNKTGRYAVTGLRGGVHQVATTNGVVSTRLWSAKTAPPTARAHALLVSDKQVLRAQCGDYVASSGCGDAGWRGRGCGWGNRGWGNGGGWGNGCGGGYTDACGNPAPAAGCGGMLLTGLVVAGVVTAIAIAADDDDDGPSSP